MNKIHLDLPLINYKNLSYQTMNNVVEMDRANGFEEQNRKFLSVGFTEKNTEYHQTFDVDDDTIQFGKNLFPRFSLSIIEQHPGQTIPAHLDTFFTFSLNNGVDPADCVRINVFLEDWKSGHYFEINETPVLHWKQGDAIIIRNNELHLSGNMGMQPKYTMQITGVWNEFTGC